MPRKVGNVTRCYNVDSMASMPMQHFEFNDPETCNIDCEIGDNIDSPNLSRSNRKFITRIRHAKCKVIRLGREQMLRFQEQQKEIEERIRINNSMWNRFRKSAHIVAFAIFIGLIIWISLVYGAVLGASICGSGQSCFPFTSSHQPHVKHTLF